MVDEPVWLNIDLLGGLAVGSAAFFVACFSGSPAREAGAERLRGLSPQLCPREIVRQNFLRALSLLGQRLGTPLAQTHTVAIALGGEEKTALLILHREAGAPQAQRFAQSRAGDALPADGQGGYIARRGERGLSEPAGRCGRVREKPSPVRACCICSAVNWTV